MPQGLGVLEAAVVHRLVDGARAGRLGHQRGIGSLEIGGEPGVWVGLDVRGAEGLPCGHLVILGSGGHLDAGLDELVGQRAEPQRDAVLDDYPPARDRRGEGKGARLHPVGHHPVDGAVEPADPLDLDGGRAGALDARAHGAEEIGQVHHLGLHRGVLDDRDARSEAGGHQQVLGAGVRGVIEHHPLAREARGADHVIRLVRGDLGAHGLKAL